MKLLLVIICAFVVADSAIPTIKELAEHCAVCNNYFAFLSGLETDHEPSEFGLFTEFGNYEKLCAICNREEDSNEETDFLSNEQHEEELNLDEVENDDVEEGEEEFIDQQEVDEEEEEPSVGLDGVSSSLLALTTCRTCREIVDFTAKNSHDFSYKAIRAALSEACNSSKIKFTNDVRCRIFVKARKDKIIKAIFRYHMDSTGTCLELGQC